jgi:hypothetical protein
VGDASSGRVRQPLAERRISHRTPKQWPADEATRVQRQARR